MHTSYTNSTNLVTIPVLFLNKIYLCRQSRPCKANHELIVGTPNVDVIDLHTTFGA